MSERVGNQSLLDIVNRFENSEIVKEIFNCTFGEVSGPEHFTDALNEIASGQLDGEKLISLIESKVRVLRAKDEADTFLGHSGAFLEYAQTHNLNGPINFKEGKLTSFESKDSSVEIMAELCLDVDRIEEYQFRICSGTRHYNVEEVLDFINIFGIDRDLLEKHNFFWSQRGGLWVDLKPSDIQVISVYHDPQRLMESGKPLFPSVIRAMSYYGLVKAGVTLRDLLVNGGVFINYSD